ncbi:glycosyltransferase family 4 protein [Ohtaekwangia sp.]|uniref:glycosyltransferase family 4 protein n=1 Tax=Ohtaekwangia sp. TaxID=2066019 RepID=UPI002FDEABF5
MTNVLINCLSLNSQFSGIDYYMKNLLDEFSMRAHQEINISALLSSHSKLQLRESPQGLLKQNRLRINTANRFRRIYFENFLLAAYQRKHGFNIYHSPNYVLPFFTKQPSVLTVHDTISLDFPDYSQTETAIYHRLAFMRSMRHASRIIAVSNTVKNDILKKVNIDSDKITVIYNGVHKHFKREHSPAKLSEIRHRYSLPERFILFVGNLEPKKNLERLIKAFHIFKKNSEHPHKLVLAGRCGWKYSSVYQAVEDLNLRSEVIFTGYVNENELPAMYSLADLFVFPSLYEGFGIPPLEAMACGTPTLTSTAGALPEVTGNVPLQVNPLDIEDIATGMHTLLQDELLRARAIEKGIAWASQFTWSSTADKTLQVYQSLVNECKGK